MRQKNPTQRGFSFIELVVALALFAVAASVIVGLESSAINRTLRDKNAQQAMLAARRIMASIEAAGPALDLPDQEGVPVSEILTSLGVPESASDDEKSALSNFRASLRLQDWDLPFENVQNPAMRKVALVIAWGDGVGDSFKIDYLFPRGPGI